MRTRDVHHVRTFFVRPGETITLKAALKGKNSSIRFRVRRGGHTVESSTEKLVFKMPSKGLGIEIAELDVNFAGRWNRLHLDRPGIDLLVRGSKGVRYTQHVIPGPKAARWIYRLISAEPGNTLYFCPESNCKDRMLPVTGIGGESVCSSCGGARMIPVKVLASVDGYYR